MAAAAVALVVGVAVAVVGRDDGGTPAAPTPTGPPVTPAPLAASTIPWYEIAVDGATTSAPTNLGNGLQHAQVWAAPDYSRVLIASTGTSPDASAEPDDWPMIEPIADPPSGVAWAFRGEDPNTWHGIYWAPDDRTSVVITDVGFSPDELAEVLSALHVEHAEGGPTVVSALSSLVQVPSGSGSLFVGHYQLPGGSADGPSASIYISDGAAAPLAMYGSGLTAITAFTTPFGEGFRMEMHDDGGMEEPLVTRIWWQVDGGPFWAGLSAPTDQIDDLLGRLVRIEEVPAPPAMPPPDSLAVLASTPSATSAPPPIPTGVSEPVMTAVAPSSLPGAGFKPPIAVGESVMGSAAEALSERGIQVHVDEAFQAVGIAEELEELRSIGAFGDVVIIQVGTNGTVTAEDLERIMAAVSDVERVVVLTARGEPSWPWVAPNNELIRALPDRYTNVVVVDWAQIATTCECLWSDGIHIQDGAVYADAIAAAAGLS